MSIIQGPYRARCRIGTTPVLALPGSQLMMPLGYQIPPAATGAVFQYQYFEGLQFPVVDFSLLPHVEWLTAANLNAWISRSADDSVSVANGVTLWDGFRGYVTKHGGSAGAKMARFVIGGRQGAPLDTRVSFWGTDLQYSEPATSLITAAIVNYHRVTFSSTGWTDANKIIAFQLTIDNNNIPNPELNQTLHPSEINAHIMTVTLSVTVQADKEEPANGDTFVIAVDTNADGNPDVTFTLGNLLVMNPYLLQVQTPRPLRTFECVGLMLANGTAPVVIS